MHQPAVDSKASSTLEPGRRPLGRLLPPAWLWILVLAYIVVLSTLSVRRHDTFHSLTYDLGMVSQVTWNTSQGRFFEVTLGRYRTPELVGSHLGIHVFPILLAVAPLYRIWSDPRLLLLLQSVALGLGAMPLFWIAQRKLEDKWLQAAVVVSYLLYPALGYANLYDFHTITLTIPLVILAYWALLEERHVVFWVCIVLALSSREEMVIPLAAFGVYLLLQKQWRRQGLILLTLALLWAVAVFVLIIPYSNEEGTYRFLNQWKHLMQQQTAASDGVSAAATRLGQNMYQYFVFVAHLLLPLGFLPLLGPGLLAVSLPSLGYLMLGRRPEFHSIGYHYTSILIPWLFLATILGLARLEERTRAQRNARARWLLPIFLLVTTLLANIIWNPIVLYNRLGHAFRPMDHDEQIKTALALIPPQAGVATVNSIGTHLTNRRYLIELEIYSYPDRRERLLADHLQHIDYVLLDLADCRYVAGPDQRGNYTEMISDILDTEQYDVRYWSERILLLERGPEPGPEVDKVRDYIDMLNEEQERCVP